MVCFWFGDEEREETDRVCHLRMGHDSAVGKGKAKNSEKQNMRNKNILLKE